MRISFGNRRRKYLYDIRFWSQGGQEKRVLAVYQGDKKIFPTEVDLAERVTLDLSPFADSEDGAWWHHAIGVLQGDYALTSDAVKKKKPLSAHVCIAGKWFDLIRKDEACPAYPLAGYEHGTLLLGDAGVPVVGLKPGDEVEVRVQIPQHETEEFGSPGQNKPLSARWYTRWLPGTALRLTHIKGQKKVCPWLKGNVTGEPSKIEYFLLPYHNHQGHWRGSVDDTKYPLDALVPSYVDFAFAVELEQGGSSSISGCRMVFPQFERVFRVKVADVVRHG